MQLERSLILRKFTSMHLGLIKEYKRNVSKPEIIHINHIYLAKKPHPYFEKRDSSMQTTAEKLIYCTYSMDEKPINPRNDRTR